MTSAGLVEAGVDAGDDDVELGERFVGQVELAFSEDVDFDAGEDVNAAGHFVVDLADAGSVGESAGIVHAVGHGEIFGVVGDGNVAATAEYGGFGHFADGAGAVRLGGVHVDVAVEVGEGDELREGVSGGGLEFAAVFAELGRNVVEVEGVVDGFFGFGGDDGVVFEAGEGVLGEGEAALDGALAEGDVVVLGAGEVLKGGAVGLAGEGGGRRPGGCCGG